MLLGACSLSELLSWFHEDQSEFEFLVIFASSGRSDSNIVQNLIQQHETVNLRTLNHTLVFFHHPGVDEYIEFKVNEYYKLFLPASEIKLTPDNPFESSRRLSGTSFETIRSVRIDNVSNLNAAKIKKIAQDASRFTEDLLQAFEYNYDNLPGFFCFTRSIREPFYASTFGVQDIEPALTFLSKLSQMEKAISSDRGLDKKISAAKRDATKILNRIGATQTGLKAIEDEHSRLVARLEKTLDLSNVTQDTKNKILDDLSLNALVQNPAEQVVLRHLETDGNILSSETFFHRIEIRQALPQIDRMRRKYTNISDEKFREKAISESLDPLTSLELELENNALLLEETRGAVQSMQTSYQSKVLVNNISKYLNTFVEKIRKINSARRELRDFMSEVK
jgi:predicted  nucleic acid-binding Zn-ribbon protein